ncbi:hypothetical protein ACFL0N_02795 [Pseudomonadota bacterium]
MAKSSDRPTDSNSQHSGAVQAGFPSWPEIPGYEESAVFALHAQLLFTQWMESGFFQHLQLRQLENLLRFSHQNSLYYQGALNFLETLPVGGLYEGHLTQLPILTFDEVQKNSQKIFVRNRPANHGRSQLVRVSNPSGQKVKIIVTGLVNTWSGALALRSQEWNDTDVSMTHLRMGYSAGLESSSSGRWSALPWSGPSTDLSPDMTTRELFRKLVQLDPGSLQAPPNVLQSLLEHSTSEGYKPPNLREVRCRGRSLNPELRTMAEKVWGLSIFHEYFLDEIGVIALQCPEGGNLHIQSEYIFVEVLNDDNSPCHPGQTGRVIVTPLHNYQTPLIRYETGDRAEAGEPCACGRTLPVLKRIVA